MWWLIICGTIMAASGLRIFLKGGRIMGIGLILTGAFMVTVGLTVPIHATTTPPM